MFAFVLAAPALASCNVDLKSNVHVCNYGFFHEDDASGEKYGIEGSDDVELAKNVWSKGKEQPTFYTYHMVVDYDFRNTQITVGENVYVGLCCAKSTIQYDKSKITLPESGNGGFFIYDCSLHGCYANMDEAIPLTNDYLEFVTLRYELTAAEEVEGEETVKTPFVIPAGVYALNEVIDFRPYFTENRVTFADPANTKLCMNNMGSKVSSQEELNVLMASMQAVKALGVSVANECYEGMHGEGADNSKNHACPYNLAGGKAERVI